VGIDQQSWKRLRAKPGKQQKMLKYFTLDYWKDGGWYVGRLREVPGVFSQGATLEELEENIEDAYRLMLEDGWESTGGVQTKQVGIEV